MTTEVETKGVARWKLGRDIPATWIAGALVAMLATGGAWTWTAVGWAQSMTVTVADLQREVVRLGESVKDGDRRLIERSDERYRTVQIRLESLDSARSADGVRIARLEEQFRFVGDALLRIERKLDGPRR